MKFEVLTPPQDPILSQLNSLSHTPVALSNTVLFSLCLPINKLLL
jgi:hypothetical protein